MDAREEMWGLPPFFSFPSKLPQPSESTHPSAPRIVEEVRSIRFNQEQEEELMHKHVSLSLSVASGSSLDIHDMTCQQDLITALINRDKVHAASLSYPISARPATPPSSASAPLVKLSVDFKTGLPSRLLCTDCAPSATADRLGSTLSSSESLCRLPSGSSHGATYVSNAFKPTLPRVA